MKASIREFEASDAKPVVGLPLRRAPQNLHDRRCRRVGSYICSTGGGAVSQQETSVHRQ
jgi:hypothetical protein